jgi:hypothetical protein
LGSIHGIVNLLRQLKHGAHGEFTGGVKQEKKTFELQTATSEDDVCHIGVSEPSAKHQRADLRC